MASGDMIVALRGRVRGRLGEGWRAGNDGVESQLCAYWQLLGLGRPGYLDAEIDLGAPRALAVRLWMDVGFDDAVDAPVFAGVTTLAAVLARVADVELGGIDAIVSLRPPLADGVEERVAMGWALYGDQPGDALPEGARVELSIDRAAERADAIADALTSRGGPTWTLRGVEPTARRAEDENDSPVFSIPRDPVIALDARLPVWSAEAAAWLVEMCLVACQDAGLPTTTLIATVRRQPA